MHLHDGRFDKEPRLAAAGAADDENIFVSRILWLLRAAVHRQVLRLRQDDVVGELRIRVRLDVLRLAP